MAHIGKSTPKNQTNAKIAKLGFDDKEKKKKKWMTKKNFYFQFKS
jgi:hypothetical protein